jgi:hypothetical protein
MTDTPILFCPFCREAFDELERCPTHDVELVTLRELGALAAATAHEDTALPLWSVRRGRGLLALGAALTLLGFFAPLARLSGDVQASSSLWTLAHGRALRLWIVPTAACAVLSMLYRRRSGVEMRSARVAAIFVSLLPSAVVLFTLHGAQSAATLMAEELHSDVRFQIGAGAWLIFAAGAVLLVGSSVFGVRRKPRVR